jgi:hypothetical protein
LSGCLAADLKRGPLSSSLTIELTGPRKEGDRIDVSTLKDSILLSVHSKSGIGRATIGPAQGGWPVRLLVRFYLKGLESFSVNNGDFVIHTSVQSYPPYKIGCETTKAGHRRGSSVSKASPYWMPARLVSRNESSPRIPLQDGYIEVVLPDVVLENRPRVLSVQWIDFLR